MSTTQILNEKPKDSYYVEISNVEEVPRRGWNWGNEWRVSTTLWMLALALLLWLATYLITVVVVVYFDCGPRSVVSLTTAWRSNGTSIVSLNEENTQYLVTF